MRHFQLTEEALTIKIIVIKNIKIKSIGKQFLSQFFLEDDKLWNQIHCLFRTSEENAFGGTAMKRIDKKESRKRRGAFMLAMAMVLSLVLPLCQSVSNAVSEGDLYFPTGGGHRRRTKRTMFPRQQTHRILFLPPSLKSRRMITTRRRWVNPTARILR